jgi:hypothetical protein
MIEFVVLMASMAGSGQPDPAQCAQLSQDAARLACYDAVFRPAPAAPAPDDAMASAAATPSAAAPAAPVAAAAVVATKDDFGLSGEQRAARAESAGVEQPKQVTGVIAEIYGSRVGKPAFRLDNGQRWRQTEATTRPMFNVGETVVIRGASMGSFLASVPDSGRPAIRVRREE